MRQSNEPPRLSKPDGMLPRRCFMTGALVAALALSERDTFGLAGQTPAPGLIRWGDTVVVEPAISAWGRMLPDAHIFTYTLHPTNGAPTVQVARSDDGWRTYQAMASIPSPPGFIQEQSHLARLADGTLLMAVRKRKEDLTWFGLPVFRSTDDGRSWEEISSIDTNPHAGGQFDRGLWEPYLLVLPDGRVTAFYASEMHASDPPWYSQTISQRISDDGGVTWGQEILAAARAGTARPGMPGVARLTDGRFILVFEACSVDNCNVHVKTSEDGVTWSDDLGIALPEQRSGPFVAALSTGQVLVTSACSNQISISSDGGQSWRLNDTPAWAVECAAGDPQPAWTWPAIYETGEREIVVVANVDRKVQLRFGSL